jgi:uncharacterized protein YdaT
MEKKLFILNGQESSILSLLAQSKGSIKKKEEEKILSVLHGKALEIAKEILHSGSSKKEDIKKAAEGFISWAKNLKGEKIES